MNIAFTTVFPEEGFKRLQEHRLNCPPDEADILIAAFNTPVPANMINRMPHLRLIANFGVGFDNIDLETCKKRGIRVTNTPFPVIEATAELCWSLVHAIVRRTTELDRKARLGGLDNAGVMSNISHSLYGMQLGIIGMGHIGQAVARRALASGLTVCYHNRTPINKNDTRWQIKYPMTPATQTIQKMVLEHAQYMSMEELLQTSDIVSLHLPYTPNVHHLFDKQQFDLMKHSAYFINTARGAIVNQNALIEALRNNTIKGAALDVYENEPDIPTELKKLDNIVLSPHVGTATIETRMQMCQNVTDNILAFLQNEEDKMNIVL